MADITTLLSNFITDLYAGVFGVNIAISKIALGDGTVAAPSSTYASDTTTGWARTGGGTIRLIASGADKFQWDNSAFHLTSDVVLSWANATTIAGAGAYDVVLVRDAANILALKNGTNAQEFRAYGSTTAPASYSSLFGVANITTTSTDGLVLPNATAATAGVTVQMSPRIRLRGSAWDTAASQTLDWFMENLPATAATPTSTLRFGHSLNGAAYTFPITFSNSGAITISDSFVGANGTTLQFGTRLQISSIGQNLAVLNGTGTPNSGIGLDFATDALLKIRTRAQTGYATVDALNFTASGTAGVASFGPAGVISITVKGGIITAIS